MIFLFYLENTSNVLADYNFPDVIHLSKQDILTCECDVLVPAALENQLNEDIAKEVRCHYIIEAANGPTTQGADKIFAERGICGRIKRNILLMS